jgi:hypothetical protein
VSLNKLQINKFPLRNINYRMVKIPASYSESPVCPAFKFRPGDQLN